MNDSQHFVIPARYWTLLESGKVRCDLCPRFCQLKEGQRGLCFVRMRRGDEIVLTTYGRSSGFCVDPIEKKPLNHYYPGSAVLSFGTAGCNLACKFCQNWDITRSKETDRLADKATPESIARAAHELDCKSVAFTYNDPVIFLEYAVDVARVCHAQGIKTVAVTAGYITPKARQEFFSHIDAVNVDLKAFTDRFYQKLCGGKLQPVLDTLCYLRNETDIWLELTTLIIPGENDSEDELDEMTGWVVENLGPDTPLHFTAFHPDWKMLDYQATDPASLTMARAIAMRNGLKYIYTGNVHDKTGGSTFCNHCEEKIIGRDWHRITSWGLDSDGCCNFCKTELPGRFDTLPGDWGAKRLPVNLSDFS